MAYIYALTDPEAPIIPRYIGRTKQNPDRRLFAHLFEAYDCPEKPLSKWLFALWSKHKVPVVIIYEVVSDADASHREIFWIRLFRKSGWLLNISDGPGAGKGRRPSPLNIQRTIERNKRGWSASTRAKQIAAKLGKTWSAERLRRWRSNPKVQANYRALAERNKSGKSRESIEKQRLALKGRKLTPEQILDRNASPFVKAARLALIERNKSRRNNSTII